MSSESSESVSPPEYKGFDLVFHHVGGKGIYQWRLLGVVSLQVKFQDYCVFRNFWFMVYESIFGFYIDLVSSRVKVFSVVTLDDVPDVASPWLRFSGRSAKSLVLCRTSSRGGMEFGANPEFLHTFATVRKFVKNYCS